MALIPPVAEQPTWVGKLQALWDFTTVKLAIIAGTLGAIGLAAPVGQAICGPDFLGWVPLWFQHTCQGCALLVTIGIVPARGTVQPGLAQKQAERSNTPVNPQTPPSGG